MPQAVWHPIAGAPKDGTEVWIRGRLPDARFDYEALASWRDPGGWFSLDGKNYYSAPTHFHLRPTTPIR